MQVLPIKLLREEDRLEFGIDLLNLAKLSRLGFPVAQGIVISPPKNEISKMISTLDFIQPQAFVAQGTFEGVLKIAIPEEFYKLASELKFKDIERLWIKVLERWNYQLKEYFHKQLKRKNILTPQSIFVIEKIIASGKIYFDHTASDSVIDIHEGELSPSQLRKLDEIVVKANKKLRVPHVYHWVAIDTKEVLIIRVSPQTNVKESEGLRPANKITSSLVFNTKLQKSNLKIFVENNLSYEVTEGLDGLVISSLSESNFEKSVHKLIEGAASFSEKPVFYFLKSTESDLVSPKDIEVFLFSRNKKQLHNVIPIIEKVESVDQFLKIKRDLASFGITRKGSLKVYLQLITPENLINVNEYILAGLDGVIINLDRLSKHLHGKEQKDLAADVKLYQINTLIKMLIGPIRLLNQNRVTVIFSGNLAFEPDMLKFILEEGVFGVVVSLAESHSLHEYINFLNLKKLPFPQL